MSSADVRAIVPEGLAPPAAVPADVFAAAMECYSEGRRLDMQALARELGMARATLYRRVGNREQLLDDVVWFRSRRALVDAVQHTGSLHGVPRLVAMVAAILRAVEADRALRAFLETDPEAAMRILTGARSTVQRGMIAALEAVIDLETQRGHYRARVDTPTLAYAIVRVSEGFLYADIIADREPDVDRALAIVEALLTGLDTNRAN